MISATEAIGVEGEKLSGGRTSQDGLAEEHACIPAPGELTVFRTHILILWAFVEHQLCAGSV